MKEKAAWSRMRIGNRCRTSASPFNLNHKFHTGCKATYTIPIHQSLETLSWKKNDKLEQMPSPRQSFQLKPVVADPQINSSLSGRLSDVLLYFLKWLEIWWSPPFLPTLNYCPLPSFCGGAAAGGFKPPRRAPALALMSPLYLPSSYFLLSSLLWLVQRVLNQSGWWFNISYQLPCQSVSESVTDNFRLRR